MPYSYPKNPKLTVWQILEWMQQNSEQIYKSKDLINFFSISDSDAPTRLSRMRQMGLVMYYDLKNKKQGVILTDYGKNFIIKQSFTSEEINDNKEESYN